MTDSTVNPPLLQDTPPLDHIAHCDALTYVQALPSDFVQCVVTSPPYFGLRDYGVAGQIGLEQTMSEYIGKLVALFHEVRRVLRPNGVVWLNLGDSYNNYGTDSLRRAETSTIGLSAKFAVEYSRKEKYPTDGLHRKSLMMIPARGGIVVADSISR